MSPKSQACTVSERSFMLEIHLDRLVALSNGTQGGAVIELASSALFSITRGWQVGTSALDLPSDHRWRRLGGNRCIHSGPFERCRLKRLPESRSRRSRGTRRCILCVVHIVSRADQPHRRHPADDFRRIQSYRDSSLTLRPIRTKKETCGFRDAARCCVPSLVQP